MSERIADPDYIAWVKTQWCIVCSDHPVDAHHAGVRGLGRKADDSTCVALCPEHHRQWHDCSGYFADRAARQLWTQRAIVMMNRRYGQHLAGNVF